MNYFNSSIILTTINKLDLSEIKDSVSFFANSKFVSVYANVFNFFKNKICPFTENSLFCKNLDNLILANLLLLFFVIAFANTGIIGVLVITSLILTALKLILSKEEAYNATIFDVPIIIYVIIAIISVAFSSYFMPSLKGLSKILVYLASYITFTNIFKGNSGKLYTILGFITVIGGLEALYGVYQQIHGVEALATWQDPETIKPDENLSRVYGTLKPYNPNLLAGYLLPMFPCALGLSVITFLKKINWASIISLLISITVLICLIFTGSRGAYIGIAAMFGTIYMIAGHLIWHNQNKYTPWLKKAWALSIIGGIIFVIAAIILLPSLQDRIESIFTIRGNSSNSFRMNVYTASIKMFLDNWLIGIGPGNTTFRLVYGLYMITGFDALGAYSVPLEIAVEMGIVGLLAFLWFILVVVSNSVKTFLSDTTLEVKLLIATILTGLIGLAGQGIFDTIWFRPQVHIIFWCFIAILANIVSKKIVFKS